VDYNLVSNAVGVAASQGTDLTLPLDAGRRKDDLVTDRVLRRVARGPVAEAARDGGKVPGAVAFLDKVFVPGPEDPLPRSQGGHPRATASRQSLSSVQRAARVLGVPDASASVSYEHLQAGLAEAGIPLSQEDFGRLISRADPHKEGRVEYGQLCDVLGLSPSKVPAHIRSREMHQESKEVSGVAEEDVTVVGDGAYPPLAPADVALFRVDPGGAFYRVPEDRYDKHRASRTFRTSMYDDDNRVLSPTGLGLATGRRRSLSGRTPATTEIVGVSDPNRLTDPGYNPRETDPVAPTVLPDRKAYLKHMEQHYRRAGGSLGNSDRFPQDTADASQELVHAGMPQSMVASMPASERVVLAERVAESTALGLRSRHLVLKGDKVPLDIREHLRTNSHVKIFDESLPFAQDDATMSKRESKQAAKQRSRSAHRARAESRLDEIRHSAWASMDRLAADVGHSERVVRSLEAQLQREPAVEKRWKVLRFSGAK
jgi:hypothetical protein